MKIKFFVLGTHTLVCISLSPGQLTANPASDKIEGLSGS